MKFNHANIFLAVSGMLFSPIAQGATIAGNAADGEVVESGGVGASVNPTIFAGSYYTGTSNRLEPVFVFQLPTLAAGTFSNVTLHLTMTSKISGTTFSGNLVGLGRIGTTANVFNSDFSATSTALLTNFVTSSTVAGAVVSNDIASWLNSQYAGGANAGSYVFLRVDTPNNTGAAKLGYNFASAENGTPSYRPYLDYTFTAVPEPSAFVLSGLGVLGLLRRRR